MPPEELHNLVYTALHVGTYLIPLLRCTVAVAVMFSSDETEMYFIVHFTPNKLQPLEACGALPADEYVCSVANCYVTCLTPATLARPTQSTHRREGGRRQPM